MATKQGCDMVRQNGEIRYPEITVGIETARKIKQCLFSNEPWGAKIACEVGYRLTGVKRLARKYYPDDDIIQILHKLNAYSPNDLLELLEESKTMCAPVSKSFKF
jgi:hypothetical protein